MLLIKACGLFCQTYVLAESKTIWSYYQFKFSLKSCYILFTIDIMLLICVIDKKAELVVYTPFKLSREQ